MAQAPPPYSGSAPGAYGVPLQQKQQYAYNQPAAPPQALAAGPAGQRTLHIYSDGRILDSNKSTILYTSQKHSWHKPNIELHSSAAGGSQIGSATFHSFSSRIDLVLHGQSLSLERNGTFRSGHHMLSYAPASGGSLTWKNAGLNSDRVCYDARGGTVATYENSGWALRKEGRLNLLGPAAVPGPLMDELVLSMLAELEYAERQSSSTASGGGGA